MTRSVIDPITRIEGHLRVEMEVQNGKVSDAWVSGGCFRGMELVVENRTPEDAAQIVQRICGVCPVSHAHASTIAAEKAYGIQISNNARIIRNLLEGAQFLHSHILWFYNLAALDYVNPLNALDADPDEAYELARLAGTSTRSDFAALKERLSNFAANGQYSIFSGNWFDAEDGTGYQLPPALDLICTAHYLEALTMQAKASEISALLGGKMPHVMTLIPGGTAFVPTEQKLDDLKYLVKEVRDWVEATMIPDTLAIAPYYKDALEWGKGCGRYVAWGVFEGQEQTTDYVEQMKNRYLPMGVIDENLNISDVQESLITEYVGHSWYKGEDTYTSPTSPPSRSSPSTTWTTATRGARLPPTTASPTRLAGSPASWLRTCATFRSSWIKWTGCSRPWVHPVRSAPRSRRSAAPPSARSSRSILPISWLSGSTSCARL